MSKQYFGRFALFIIYFWFGLLKVLSVSPASPMVSSLLKMTMPFFPEAAFLMLFGLFEMLIGILFLFPKYKKITLALFYFHIFTTTLPLVLLPQMVWTGFFVPTLEGQYIIKNIALVAISLFI